MAVGQKPRAETIKRVYEVKRQILEGHYSQEIVNYCKETWGIEETQAFHYISAAKKEIQEQYEKDSETAIRHIVAQMEDLYRANRKIKDYKAAHAVLKSLLELYSPSVTKVELSGNVEIINHHEIAAAEFQRLVSQAVVPSATTGMDSKP